VGGDLRASASFQYATIASMFFELVAPLAIVLAATARSRSARLLALMIAAACSAMVVLTLTRAGIGALVLAFGLLLWLAWAGPRWRSVAVPTAVAAACAVLVAGGLATQLSAFSTRFSTENDWDWYGATYQAPSDLTLSPDATTAAVITVQNTGQATWTTDGDHRFGLAYRWLSSDAGSELDVPTTVFDLPTAVPPGGTVEVPVDIRVALPPGDYRVAWGMLQRNVLWFHDRGSRDAETLVHLDGQRADGTVAVARQPRSDLDIVQPPTPRGELWSAALRIVARYPLLGIGPDNFRHVYGAYVGLPIWDERVHANNLYLELLADTGVLGALAFAVVMAPVVAGLVRGLRKPLTSSQALLCAGLAASLAAFLVHGVFDYFLEFTPVYLLFWLVVGLSLNVARRDVC
jgi:O-antigen ligase